MFGSRSVFAFQALPNLRTDARVCVKNRENCNIENLRVKSGLTRRAPRAASDRAVAQQSQRAGGIDWD
jgi:hypothetical protein